MSRVYRMLLENLGPISTYSMILSILSITMHDIGDLYASLKILTISFTVAASVNPIKLSALISLTNWNPDSTAAHAAILVLPEPTSPSNKTEFSYEFFPFLVYSIVLLRIEMILSNDLP
jgi:hypothetical protein